MKYLYIVNRMQKTMSVEWLTGSAMGTSLTKQDGVALWVFGLICFMETGRMS